MSSAGESADGEVRDSRERILDHALDLMSRRGARGTSMRKLAEASGVNVGTIYHYFPSKADLLRSVIEERRYVSRLKVTPPVVGAPPAEALEGLIVELWLGAVEEEQVWRLLLGESLRGDATALGVSLELLGSIESAFADWLPRLFPELAERSGAVGSVVIGQLYMAIIERLIRPEMGPDEVRARARAVADLVVGR